jgi:phosphotriesterase-related protein
MTSMHDHVFCDLRYYRSVERKALAAHGDLDLEFSLSTRGLVRDEGFFLSSENCLLDDRDAMTEELRELRQHGGQSMLELSCPGLRTNVEGVRDIARLADVNIVVSTGLYIEPSWPAKASAMDEDELEAFMVDEIENEIGDTRVQAGHIGEIGVTRLGEGERRVLRAAARAAVRTGVAMTVHPGWDASCDGRAILPILVEAGLAPERTIFAHGDAFFVEHDLRQLVREHERSWKLQTAYHEELLAAGATVSIDCFGHEWNIAGNHWMIESDVQRLAGVVALLERGYTDQIVLGTDICFKMLTRRGGGRGYAHLPGWVLPTLSDLGVSDLEIEKLSVGNPARLLARVET